MIYDLLWTIVQYKHSKGREKKNSQGPRWRPLWPKETCCVSKADGHPIKKLVRQHPKLLEEAEVAGHLGEVVAAHFLVVEEELLQKEVAAEGYQQTAAEAH